MPVIASGILLALAAFLPGCASKNPLMEEPAPSAAATAKPADAAPVTSANAGSGVQTIRQRRFLGIFSPYRVDIQQGNFVSREMVAQLKESMKDKGGMTPAQVRFVMGTPLLTDVFHKDRWDYVFRLQKNNGEIISSHIALFFQDNRLVRLEGGDLPTESDYISLIAGNAQSKAAAPAPAPDAK